MKHENQFALCRRAARRRSYAGSVHRLPRTAIAAAVSLALLAIIALPATACPNCAPARQARSEVWSDNFALHFGFVALPFLVIGGLCLAAEAIERTRAHVRAREAKPDRPTGDK